MQQLEGHSDEIFSCSFNYEGDTIITGSKDNTCGIWRDKHTYVETECVVVLKSRQPK